uniref:Uncharacterized protein n=1 Tax=Parascaris equorum TaxID=6256 RepID=A0A914S3L6_PAREQ
MFLDCLRYFRIRHSQYCDVTLLACLSMTSFFRDSLSHPFTIFEMDDALVPHFYRLSYYPNESMNSSDSENRSPNTDDSDCSMERSPLQSPRKYQCTPLKQTKLTGYYFMALLLAH